MLVVVAVVVVVGLRTGRNTILVQIVQSRLMLRLRLEKQHNNRQLHLKISWNKALIAPLANI